MKNLKQLETSFHQLIYVIHFSRMTRYELSLKGPRSVQVSYYQAYFYQGQLFESYYLFFLKILLIFRESGGEGERERNINMRERDIN